MEREIKFRAFDDGKMITMPLCNNYGLSRFFGIIREDAIIMQYTGLKDKNGVDIYEGDVVAFNIPNIASRLIFEVVFTKGLFGVVYKGMELQLNDLENIEVIGNIHE